MENNTNRNDVIKFFRDMPQQMQIEMINKMQRQIKKPPDLSFENTFRIESNSTTLVDYDKGNRIKVADLHGKR